MVFQPRDGRLQLGTMVNLNGFIVKIESMTPKVIFKLNKYRSQSSIFETHEILYYIYKFFELLHNFSYMNVFSTRN